MDERVTLEVRRDAWSETRTVREAVPELAPGEVLFRVDRFALTANNISYALAGDMLEYWSFFPAEHGFGRIPVMGFGDVERSAHPEVAAGVRVFGFFPMSTHLVVQADAVRASGLVDAAPHRANTAPAYRQYTYTASDPQHAPAREDQIILLRGLFMTSFLVDDFLADAEFFGARRAIVTSASSKTSIALAYQLAGRPDVSSIGLTAERNLPFVRGLGLYDEVVSYGAAKDAIPAGEPAVIVDMAGNGAVLGELHQHLGENVRHSCIVGATHWDHAGRPDGLPGAEPSFFFAPSQAQKRAADWGPAVMQQKLGAAWGRFVDSSDAWLRISRGRGAKQVEETYQAVLGGRARPEQGHVLSLWEA